MDRARLSSIGHGELRYWNPVSSDVIESYLDDLALDGSVRVLDAGCGRAELIIRIAERHECHCVGVDSGEIVLAEARRQRDARVSAGLVELRLEPFDDGRFADGQFGLAVCVGASHAVGGYEPALRSLTRVVEPGGWLLIGEGYWKRPPPQPYLAFLGCDRESLQTHEGNRTLARRHGLEVVRDHESTADEWSRYEDTYYENVIRFVENTPDDADAAAFRAHITGWRDAYLRWGRDTLGFGLYALRRDRRPREATST